jgi:hypothetical protein
MTPKLVTSKSPKRVTLADVYFHFLALSPSPRQAGMELAHAIRNKKLKLIAGSMEERRRGEKPRINHNKQIPANALTDQLRMKFDWELSSAVWKGPDRFEFWDISAARDDVIALRPAPSSANNDIVKRFRGGRRPAYEWDAIFAIVLRLYDEDGRPDVKSYRKFAKRVCDTCSKDGMEPVPGEHTVREKLSIWFGKIGPR